MADLYIDNSGPGGSTPSPIGGYNSVPALTVGAGIQMYLSLGGVTSAAGVYSTDAPATDLLSSDLDELVLKTNMANAFTLSGVRFSQGGKDYVVKASGQVQRDVSPVTGNGTVVGVLSGGQGALAINDWAPGSSPEVTNWRGVAGAPVNGPDTPFATYAVTFRVPTAPLRTGSFSVLGSMKDGTTFNVTADSNGYINTPRIKGRVNYTTGVVQLVGVTPTVSTDQEKISLAFLGIPGVANEFVDLIQQETLRYNAVAYTYLPMEASLLGINPVRLPSDGRVPIFRAGGIIVVGNKKITSPATVSNGQTLNMARTRLSRVNVVGADGLPIYTGWEADLEAGTVHFTSVAGYSQPIKVEHRVEDMSMLRDVQIDGTLTMLRPLTHDYEGGETYVSSAFMAGDLKARSLNVFDQASWDGTTFSDILIGDAALATYNDTDNPIVVTNAGALTEKWVIRFTSSTAFQVIGENVGVITVGNTGADCSPINTRTGEPYFTIPQTGWGTGWSVGNILRFNTVGAQAPVWLVRTVQQGPEAGDNYSFTLLARGDIDNPI